MLTPITTYVRIAGFVGAVVALGIVVAVLHSKFERWRQDLYDTAYAAGVTDTSLKWQTASSKYLSAQIAVNETNAENTQAAMGAYVSNMRALLPKLQSLSDRKNAYVASPAGKLPCLDVVGANILRDHRAALGLGPSSSPATHPSSATSP